MLTRRFRAPVLVALLHFVVYNDQNWLQISSRQKHVKLLNLNPFSKNIIQFTYLVQGSVSMSYLISGLFVILITSILIGITFLIVFRNKNQAAQGVQSLAAQKGWRYEKVNEAHANGYRLRGRDWTYEAIKGTSLIISNTASLDSAQVSQWSTTVLNFTPGILLIGPKQFNVDLGGIGAVVNQAMLTLMIGDAADDALGIEESLIGHMALHERYMIWTNQEEKARDLLTTRVENALIQYPGKIPPVVKFNKDGLVVKVFSKILDKPEEIAGVIAIGEAFLL